MIRCLVALAVCALAAFARMEPREIEELFGQANALYREANETSLRDPSAAREIYQRAALRLERIAREGGIRNGKLFYNLGNAYYQAGDIGRAILNYRRAELYVPGDPNLAQNLAQARKSRQDSIEEKQRTRVLRTLLFWHYDMSRAARAWLLALFSGAFWAGAAVRLRRSEWMPRTALAAAGALAVLFLVSLAAEAAGDRRPAGVILAAEVTARKGDGESYEPSFQEPLHAGAEFELLETRSGWRHIELPDGRQCWIPAGAAAPVPLDE
ncbi:MAG: hypothetical protein KIT09_15270 [Bryobacteraceae bacterium]|nr:hypothetical protein [Bryobacteraceae bacterium]